ncbi:MAG: DUF6436 domain-containing protein [Bermanella sp.]
MQPPSKTGASQPFIVGIMVILALWLAALLIFASWFQGRYIQAYTQQTPQFLQASFSDHWFRQLSPLLPPKSGGSRVIQLWQPDCLCNRFARRHALSAMTVAKALNIEHITLIPRSAAHLQASLQSLNPDTRILILDHQQLPHWPASPTLLIEDPLARLVYFGPLGFGAFCSQSSSSIIDSQLNKLQGTPPRPFFNVIGKGCFCPWQ